MPPLDGLLATTIIQTLSGSVSSDLVSNLLTGGGFVFLAAIVGGLAVWNKNQSESAKTIAEGSREFVEGARIELAAARKEAATARKEAATARRELDDLMDTSDRQRRKLALWMRAQQRANDEHNAWDDELKAELERLGGTIRPAPPLPTCSPADPNYPG